MIPLILQDCMVDEVKSLFAGLTFKNTKGVLVPLNVYPQRLPARKEKKDPDYYPFIIVQLLDGEDPDETDPNKCRLVFQCGTFDDEDDYQGYRDCMNLVQKMYTHFMSKRLFGKRYMLEHPTKWLTTEEDYYPHYYAALETNWTVGKVTMADNDLT